MESSSSSENIFSFESLIARAGADHRGRDDYLFVCTGGPLNPRRTEIPRWNTEAVSQHKANCEKCSQIEKERQEEQKLKNEGPLRLQAILDVIRNAKLDIEHAKTKKAEFELLEQKKREKGEEAVVPDYWEQKEKLRLAEFDAGVAEATIQKERIELGKLLSHENEVIRQGAKEAYLRYINGMKKLKKEKEAVTPLSPSSPSLSSLKRSLGALT